MKIMKMTPQVILPAMSCKSLEMQAYACHGTKTLSRQKVENKSVKLHMLYTIPYKCKNSEELTILLCSSNILIMSSENQQYLHSNIT